MSWNHIFQLLEALFPGEDHPSEDRIRQWYNEAPDYPAQLKSLGLPSPEDFIQQRCQADPEVAEKMIQIGLSKPQPKHQQIKPCEADSVVPQPIPTALPVFYARPRLCVSSSYTVNEAVSQLFSAMCQVVILAMVGYFMREWARLATS